MRATDVIRMNDMLPYVYAKADAQRGRKGGTWRQALRGGTRHVGFAARRAVLDLLSKPPRSDDETPVLRLLRGAARGVPVDAHRQHLSRKYG